MHPETLYRIFAAGFVAYCAARLGLAWGAGACVMVALNEWVRRNGGWL